MLSPLIALVEDNPLAQELVAELLAEEGYRVLPLARAAGAQDVIRRRRPRAVILDLWLETPAAGWELLTALRAGPATRGTPIIVCSAGGSLLRERAACLPALCCAVLPKLFELDVLLAALGRALSTGPGIRACSRAYSQVGARAGTVATRTGEGASDEAGLGPRA